MKNYASCTDEALALLYIDGDNKAFDELLARNQQKLFSYIMFVVRDPELGDYQVARRKVHRFWQVCLLADAHCP